jgi:DNA repair exonuclease SbcCD nuclease subunit
VSPQIAEELRKSTFEAFNAVLDLCIAEQVDALLVAGDIFDSADQSLLAQLAFVDGLKRLESEGIRSFVCHGNHDPLDAWRSEIPFPQNTVRFGNTVVSSVLRPGDPDSPLVYGFSYPTREVHDNIVKEFQKVFQPGRVSIGLLHANVGADTGHASYAPCTKDDLESVGIKYWALGHVHTRNEIHLKDGVAVYPGNIQGRHINESGPRGVYLVTMTEDGSTERFFRPMDLIRWDEMEVDIADLYDSQSIESLETAIAEKIEASLARADGRHLIYRVSLTGRGPLHTVVNESEFNETQITRLNDEYTNRRPFAYCDRITTATRKEINREDYSGREDFYGDLLRFFDQARTDSSIIEELQSDLKQLYGHPRLGGRLSDQLPEADALASLLDEAESLCLDLLVPEDEDEN